MSLRATFVCSACAWLAAGTLGARAADKPAPTIKDLEARKVEIRKDAKVDTSAAKAMDNYRRFLDLQKTDPQLRAEALRRLGDLNIESGEVDRLSSEVTQIDLMGAEAIKLYSTLLKAYPDYPRNDQVLYQLARAYETTGQPDKALATLDQALSRYPQSSQIDEVQFRRGELLFSSKRYREAAEAYGAVVQRPASSFYVQALYKHGWALFKQSMNEESLDSFAGVLDATLVDRKTSRFVSPESLSRADRELADDTLRVMSITFSYLEGPPSVDAFVRKRGDMPYAHLLYSRLGDLYIDKQRYQDAAGAYRAYVAAAPNSEYSPALSMQAIDAYSKGGFTDLVIEGKHEFVERYNFGSDFWKGRARAQFPEVAAALKTNLEDVATYFHARAQKSKQISDYEEAARWYRDFLQSFPDDPDSAGTNYLLAETLFEAHRYGDAAAEYERTAYQYPKNEKSATAAYAALVSYQKEEDPLSGDAKTALHRKATDAGVRFAEAFPDHPDSAGVLTRAAEDIFADHDLPRAIKVANEVLARSPPVDAAKQRIAWTVIAQAQFDQGAFGDAEGAFVKARDLVANDPKMRTDLNERLATAIYRQAEAKRKAGDPSAVDDFLRIAQVAPESRIRSTAQYDAAAQLINLMQWDRAIGVLEAFRRDYPQNSLQSDVTTKLAVAYAAAGRPAQAAAEYERIASVPNQDKAIQREAILQAADLYAQANERDKSAAMLERFLTTGAPGVVEGIEARQRLADYAQAAGNRAEQLRWDREIVRVDGQAGAQRTDRTRYLAAKAQLALAEPARDAFRSVRLVAPLKKSLVAKRKALESALAAYKQADSYQVAEVTTAATYEMAELYRTLGKDIMSSERPKRLSKDELEQYDTLLEEQAFPFEEQAINLHQVNAARAADNLYDENVRRSFQVLAELKPARFGKTELSQINHATADLDDSEKRMREAVAAEPANPAYWNELGVTLRLRGQFNAAADAYEHAIAADPMFAPAHRNYAVLLDLYRNDPVHALAEMQRYKELSGDDKLLNGWLADLTQRAGQAAPRAAAPAPGAAPSAGTAPAQGAAPSAGTAPAPDGEPAPAAAPNAPPGNTQDGTPPGN